jgi:hypothetical protein
MPKETDLTKLQRMRAEYKGWRGEVVDDAIAEIAALRVEVKQWRDAHDRSPPDGECAVPGEENGA